MKKEKKRVDEFLAPADFKKLCRLMKKIMPPVVWFQTHLQKFDEDETRYNTLVNFMEQQARMKKLQPSQPAATELAKKFKQLHLVFEKLLADYSAYADVFLIADNKGTILFKNICNEKKKEQAASNLVKFEEVYKPLIREIKVFQKRCEALEPLFKECETLMRKEMN